MGRNTQRDWLYDQGWTDPLDESPVETPEGWYGGAVTNTGGHVMCRIWISVPSYGTYAGSHAYEVIYGTEFGSVALQLMEWHDDGDGDGWYEFSEILEIREAREDTDAATAEAARELMESRLVVARDD